MAGEDQLQLSGRVALAQKQAAYNAMSHGIADMHEIPPASAAPDNAPNRAAKARGRGGGAPRKRRKNAAANSP